MACGCTTIWGNIHLRRLFHLICNVLFFVLQCLTQPTTWSSNGFRRRTCPWRSTRAFNCPSWSSSTTALVIAHPSTPQVHHSWSCLNWAGSFLLWLGASVAQWSSPSEKFSSQQVLRLLLQCEWPWMAMNGVSKWTFGTWVFFCNWFGKGEIDRS